MIDLPTKAEVHCSDGLAGRSTYIIINPINHQVTHLVVRSNWPPFHETLVPFDQVEGAAPDQINLKCTRNDLNQMESFEREEYFRAEIPGYIFWPFSVPVGETIPEDVVTYIPEKHKNIPQGELALHRGARVEATDSYVGQVDELLVNSNNMQITHLVLLERHVFKPREITIPVSQIEQVDENTIYLKLDRKSVEELPTTPIQRWPREEIKNANKKGAQVIWGKNIKGEMKMKTDTELRKDIEEEILWEPSVVSTEIGVIVDDGVVTLTGSVETLPEKFGAEKATLRVAGVKAVANEIKVKLSVSDRRPDEEIARAAANALVWNVFLPRDLQTVVDDGWVTLKGKANWQYQKRAAEDTVRGLTGVKGVTNDIIVTPRVAPSVVKAKIEAAITRNAFLDAKGIQVKAEDGKVTLEGTVYSWLERAQAEDAAWSAPGVTEVDNKLVVY